MIKVQRLGQKVVRTLPQGLHGLRHRSEGGHNNEGGNRREAPTSAQQLQSVCSRQTEVADDEFGRPCPRQSQGLIHVAGGTTFIADIDNLVLKQLRESRIVFND
jgi:hypothetical protein